MKKTDFARLARALKALAHADRLAVVRFLADGERCVCEIQEVMGSQLPTVSRHLKLMVDAGILESRRDGQKILYRLKTPCVADFIGCLESVLAGEPCGLLSKGRECP
jgi:DNA-binding transcriptional ArsR family regulator